MTKDAKLRVGVTPSTNSQQDSNAILNGEAVRIPAPTEDCSAERVIKLNTHSDNATKPDE